MYISVCEKTYTMGTAGIDSRNAAHEMHLKDAMGFSPHEGLVPRAITEIFRMIDEKTSERNTFKVCFSLNVFSRGDSFTPNFSLILHSIDKLCTV